MKILVVNSGSSSLKFQLFKVPDLRVQDLRVLAVGLIEQINGKNSSAHLQCFDGDGDRKEEIERGEAVGDHSEAVRMMQEMLCESGMMCDFDELAAIGHRVVHGGELFHDPTLITGKVIQGIEELIPLAPLHNPANLIGIREAARHAGDIPQVAVFDTAFHRTIPPHAYLYALPYELYEREKVRRYGFHGISHGYVSRRAAEYFDRPLAQHNIITLHLGNGVSAAAIKGGRCVDTSMGMTPLEGLIMGTRCGDLDPAILFYLGRETGMSMADLDNLLNKESGLKGICGRSDMRTITEMAEQGDEQAGLALTMFCYRL
ncbi:acetate kinase, partial [Desulfobulbus sp. US5]|nr:acetate kinase [Desulfobulbus sp. US5]